MATSTKTPLVNVALVSAESVGAGASGSFNLYYPMATRITLTCRNTAGTVHATTFGVRFDIFWAYGATPTKSPDKLDARTVTAIASSTKSIQIVLPGGNWVIDYTNLDPSNGITLNVDGDVEPGTTITS